MYYASNITSGIQTIKNSYILQLKISLKNNPPSLNIKSVIQHLYMLAPSVKIRPIATIVIDQRLDRSAHLRSIAAIDLLKIHR